MARYNGAFTPQASGIYKLLAREKLPLTAKQIATRLHILPNAVYRAIEQLIELGFATKQQGYPISFRITSPSNALDEYVSKIRKELKTSLPGVQLSTSSDLIDIAFLSTREELRNNTDRDIQTVKKSVHFIVSGLEVPAETIFIYKNAIDRGVDIRALVQRVDDTSKTMFANWKKIGLKIRYFPNMEARMFIIDKQIVYFTSYDADNKEEAVGTRFNYPPYALLMDELFELRWKLGKEI